MLVGWLGHWSWVTSSPRLVLGWVTAREDWALWICVRSCSSVRTLICTRRHRALPTRTCINLSHESLSTQAKNNKSCKWNIYRPICQNTESKLIRQHFAILSRWETCRESFPNSEEPLKNIPENLKMLGISWHAFDQWRVTLKHKDIYIYIYMIVCVCV